MSLKGNPFDHNKLLGAVSEIGPNYIRAAFVVHLNPGQKFLHGQVITSGQVGDYVLIDGQDRAIFGKINKVRLPDKDRKPDEFLDFNLRKIPPFQLGVRCELIGEEWEITGVSPFFQEMVETEHCEKVTGMRVISLTAGNVELVFFRNHRHPWRSLAGGWPDHPKLGDARTVTLELRDPYSRRRMKIEWPRLRIRLNRETDKYESF